MLDLQHARRKTFHPVTRNGRAKLALHGPDGENGHRHAERNNVHKFRCEAGGNHIQRSRRDYREGCESGAFKTRQASGLRNWL